MVERLSPHRAMLSSIRARWYAGQKTLPKNARPARTVRVSTTSIRENLVDLIGLSISTPFQGSRQVPLSDDKTQAQCRQGAGGDKHQIVEPPIGSRTALVRRFEEVGAPLLGAVEGLFAAP